MLQAVSQTKLCIEVLLKNDLNKINELVPIEINCLLILLTINALVLFLVPSENKKDQRSIEQTLADIQSKKRMKLNHQSTDGKDGTLPK